LGIRGGKDQKGKKPKLWGVRPYFCLWVPTPDGKGKPFKKAEFVALEGRIYRLVTQAYPKQSEVPEEFMVEE